MARNIDNYIYRKMLMLLVSFKNYKTKYIINLFVISKSKPWEPTLVNLRVNYWENIGKLKAKRTGCKKDKRSSSRGTTIQTFLSAITEIKGQFHGNSLRWKMKFRW